MWFPTASLVHFCWNQAHPVRTLLGAAGRQSILVKSEVLPPFHRKEWGLWLSCSASSNGPCRRQKPMQAATTASSQGSFTPKEGASCNGFSAAGVCHLQCTYQKIFILHPKHTLPLRQSKKVSNGTDTKMIKMIFFRGRCSICRSEYSHRPYLWGLIEAMQNLHIMTESQKIMFCNCVCTPTGEGVKAKKTRLGGSKCLLQKLCLEQKCLKSYA